MGAAGLTCPPPAPLSPQTSTLPFIIISNNNQLSSAWASILWFNVLNSVTSDRMVSGTPRPPRCPRGLRGSRPHPCSSPGLRPCVLSQVPGLCPWSSHRALSLLLSPVPALSLSQFHPCPLPLCVSPSPGPCPIPCPGACHCPLVPVPFPSLVRVPVPFSLSHPHPLSLCRSPSPGPCPIPVPCASPRPLVPVLSPSLAPVCVPVPWSLSHPRPLPRCVSPSPAACPRPRSPRLPQDQQFFSKPPPVPWPRLAEVLSWQFESVAERGLSRDHLLMLAEKLFGKAGCQPRDPPGPGQGPCCPPHPALASKAQSRLRRAP